MFQHSQTKKPSTIVLSFFSLSDLARIEYPQEFRIPREKLVLLQRTTSFSISTPHSNCIWFGIKTEKAYSIAVSFFLLVTSLGLNILCPPNDKSKSWILSEFNCLFHLSIYETKCFNIHKQKSQVLLYSAFSFFVTSLGFKPRTSWAVIKYSIQLSYEANFVYKDNAFFSAIPNQLLSWYANQFRVKW